MKINLFSTHYKCGETGRYKALLEGLYTELKRSVSEEKRAFLINETTDMILEEKIKSLPSKDVVLTKIHETEKDFKSYSKTEEFKKDKERQKELDYCLQSNLNNPIIDSVKRFDNRPLFSHFFEQTVNYPNDINILANSDIYFDETLEYVKNIGPRECFAITRAELKDGEVVTFSEMHTKNKEAKPQHSQDVWVFFGAVTNVFGGFYIGIPGCDNRIAYEIFRGGYNVKNPCYMVNAIHKHEEELRNYSIPEDSPNKIPPPYRWVFPDVQKQREPI